MESGYGAQQGELDVIRSIATLAATGRRRPWAEGELLACLTIIGSGEAPRERLRGSWAGAMGQTQMLPSTYLSSAVDGDGDGKRDIWTSAPDALASAANLLAKGGWRRGEGWAREVILPARFRLRPERRAGAGPGLVESQRRAAGGRRDLGCGRRRGRLDITPPVRRGRPGLPCRTQPFRDPQVQQLGRLRPVGWPPRRPHRRRRRGWSRRGPKRHRFP